MIIPQEIYDHDLPLVGSVIPPSEHPYYFLGLDEENSVQMMKTFSMYYNTHPPTNQGSSDLGAEMKLATGKQRSLSDGSSRNCGSQMLSA